MEMAPGLVRETSIPVLLGELVTPAATTLAVAVPLLVTLKTTVNTAPRLWETGRGKKEALRAEAAWIVTFPKELAGEFTCNDVLSESVPLALPLNLTNPGLVAV